MRLFVLGLHGGGVACYAAVIIMFFRMLRRAKHYDREVEELTQSDQDSPLTDQERKRFQDIIKQGFMKPLRWIIALFALGAVLQVAGVVMRALYVT